VLAELPTAVANEPLCDVTVMGTVRQVRHRYVRGTLTIPKHQHAYHVGNQEIAQSGKEAWLSTVDTGCWWLQNDLASERWPCSDEGKAEVRDNWIVGHKPASAPPTLPTNKRTNEGSLPSSKKAKVEECIVEASAGDGAKSPAPLTDHTSAEEDG